eukprot:2523785-Lingulodinium_polyedra.AAC.1
MSSALWPTVERSCNQLPKACNSLQGHSHRPTCTKPDMKHRWLQWTIDMWKPACMHLTSARLEAAKQPEAPSCQAAQ